jgi:hypothetical protein
VSYASVTPRASDGLSTNRSFGIMPVPNRSSTPGSPQSFFCCTSRTTSDVSPAIQPLVGRSQRRPFHHAG